MDFSLIAHAAWDNCWLSSFTIFILYIIGSVIYELYFSPLAKIPGPFLAKITGWTSFYYALTGYRHIWIWQCHQIYGPIFRFAPNGVLVNTATGYHSINNYKANVKRGKLYEMGPRNAKHISTFNLTDKNAHSKRRRILNAIFSDAATRSTENFIIQNVDRWCELLLGKNDKEWSEPLNFSTKFSELMLDITGDLAFGKSFSIKEPKQHPLKDMPMYMEKHVMFIYPSAQSPLMDIWVWLKPRGLNNLLRRFRPEPTRIFEEFVDNIVRERTDLELKLQEEAKEESENSKKDLFHYILNAKDAETGRAAYSPDEINAEAALLIQAGGETTSAALCSTFFYLIRCPRAYKRVTSEVRNTFASADEIQGGAKLSSCHYLRACIDEAIRMTTPGPGERPRVALDGGLHVDGHFIPKGTRVGSSSWALYHKEEYFGDAWTYRPERWIVDEENGVTTADVALAQSAFHPFSIGLYNCVGRQVAWQEMLITTAKILHQMDVRVPPGDSTGGGAPELGWGRRNKNHYHIRDAFVAIKNGPMTTAYDPTERLVGDREDPENSLRFRGKTSNLGYTSQLLDVLANRYYEYGTVESCPRPSNCSVLKALTTPIPATPIQKPSTRPVQKPSRPLPRLSINPIRIVPTVESPLPSEPSSSNSSSPPSTPILKG
ncbi:hypothetical protein G7Y89_g8609 [Cudoniella acicularis]|uniref:Cytochrome P450 n=1 Tax=Cudoniella acicularis TaxID=354080 RepID=A0A8H4RG95_9HELO|nr:hypothetical protein G7Y89_g8609 [Cudoniella acicularis]